ncbi:MAG: hypothetical protein QW212_00600 [Nitrososphaerales archaeon]
MYFEVLASKRDCRSILDSLSREQLEGLRDKLVVEREASKLLGRKYNEELYDYTVRYLRERGVC